MVSLFALANSSLSEIALSMVQLECWRQTTDKSGSSQKRRLLPPSLIGIRFLYSFGQQVFEGFTYVQIALVGAVLNLEQIILSMNLKCGPRR